MHVLLCDKCSCFETIAEFFDSAKFSNVGLVSVLGNLFIMFGISGFRMLLLKLSQKLHVQRATIQIKLEFSTKNEDLQHLPFPLYMN